jgi:metallo-beta-lactamase family protein
VHVQRVTASDTIVSFLGGTRTVTGSRFLVDTPNARVLVDAGLFQGIKPLRLRNRAPLGVDPASIDAVVVTHAHLDHTGYLPALVKQGFAGRIHMTRRTAQLAEIVLADSARLQQEEAEFANRHGYSKHHPALPLYTEADAFATVERFRTEPFLTDVEIAPGVAVEFRPAGHIVGSASVVCTLEGRRTRRLFVSGDVGRPVHPLLLPPVAPPAVDVALVESTYGDRDHDDETTALDAIAQAISRAAAAGGTIVMPAFAVDRTEVVLVALRRLLDEHRIPPLPIYVDSPMALDVLSVYRAALREHDVDVRPVAIDALAPGGVHEARDRNASQRLNDLTAPAIIVSASGMATGGRVLHHLARVLPHHRNSVVLVGFQAEGTRGRQLAQGARVVKLLGQYVPVRADIVVADAFSAHADADELVSWLGSAPAPPEVTFVVHGEAEASDALASRLDRELRRHAVVPTEGERVRIG